MSTKRVRLITLSGLALIILVVVAGLLMTYGKRYTEDIALPVITETTGPTPSGAVSSSNGIVPITVTKDNVQAVVATLKRPENYSRKVRIELFSGDGSSIFNISTAVIGNVSSLQVAGAGTQKNIIVTQNKRYVWYDGDRDAYQSAVGTSSGADRTSDEDQMLLTYQDIVALDKDAVTDAGYGTYNEENCIYVTYLSPLLHYKTICYISPDSGLLVGAEQYDGTSLVYRMTTSDFDRTVPGEARFQLPDGTNVLNDLSQG